MPDSSTPRKAPARLVAIGGGTGLSTLLRGIKEYVAPRPEDAARYPLHDLVAVVTVSDDGGSSGRLRREYSMLPPGDVRNCLVALSQDEALMGRLFQYRFHAGRGLRGHSFGNLFLTALSHVTGDFTRAVRVSSEVLAIRGRIFPSTNQLTTLEAVLENGKILTGESRIGATPMPIRRVRLTPRNAKPLPEVLEAIASADLIVLGPGSLYTSVIPNLLVCGVAEAIEKSPATRVYISNIMTQPGETRGYTLVDHVKAIHRHAGRKLVDWIIVNNKPVGADVARRYRSKGSEPVDAQLKELQRLGLRCVFDSLVETNGVIRHDPNRLAKLLIEEFVRNDPGR